MTGISYRSSIDYIIKNIASFEYPVYYYNFCNGMDRAQTKRKLKRDLEDSVFEFEASVPEIEKWVKEQLENDIPIAETTDVDTFWLAILEHKTTIREIERATERRAVITGSVHDATLNYTRNANSRLTLLNSAHNIIEADTLLSFNERSIGSIIKSEGKKLFARYGSLNDQEKVKGCYCINGILDLTSEVQKSLFTECQWSLLLERFKSRRLQHMPKLNLELQKIVREVQKCIRNGFYHDAYYFVLLSIAKSMDKWLLKILAHILNCYIERSRVFESSEKSLTGNDFMAKIWNEFFEHMFADGYLLVKSGGEPVSSTTTQVKPRNSSIISCKVDGRTVASINGILELRQIEASKLLNSNAKVRHEQAKLAIECKCILDDIVRSLSFSRDKPHYIHGVQICGLQAQVSSLSLIDSGLYTNVGDFSFSLPSDIDEFGENLPMWTRKILSFRNSCIYSATNYKSAVNLEKRNHKIAPHETVPSRKKLSEWTRGTFFIPEKDQEPHFPDGFLGNSSSSCYDDAIYDKYYLDDGTLVKERRYVTKKRMDKTKQDKKTITKEGSSNKEAEANEYPNKKKKGNDEQRNTSTEAI